MTVSKGFQRKIEDWLISEDWSVAFCPFLAKTNPYKAKVAIVGASVQPKVEADDLYVEALLNWPFYNEYYQYATHSRENKGVLAFAEKLSEHVPVVISTMNTLMVDQAKDLTAQKKSADYARGQEIFKEVLQEFEPELIVLHGAEAVKQFRLQFAEHLQDDFVALTKVQELEKVGVFATLTIGDCEAKVLACRSLSQYGEGTTFAAFQQKIMELVG